MAKPTSLPAWATSGSIIVPSATKQATGHLAGEQPIPQYENWRENLVYQWTAWLNGLWGSDGSLTMDNNANITLQGTGYLKSGNFTSSFAFDTGGWNSSGAAPTFDSNLGSAVDIAAGVTAYKLLALPDDTCRIQSLFLAVSQQGGVDGTVSIVTANATGSAGVYAAVTGASATVTAGSTTQVTITPTTPFKLCSVVGSPPSHTVWLKVTAGSGGVLTLLSGQWTLDRP